MNPIHNKHVEIVSIQNKYNNKPSYQQYKKLNKHKKTLKLEVFWKNSRSNCLSSFFTFLQRKVDGLKWETKGQRQWDLT
jgi:hypothetical protein